MHTADALSRSATKPQTSSTVSLVEALEDMVISTLPVTDTFYGGDWDLSLFQNLIHVSSWGLVLSLIGTSRLEQSRLLIWGVAPTLGAIIWNKTFSPFQPKLYRKMQLTKVKTTCKVITIEGWPTLSQPRGDNDSTRRFYLDSKKKQFLEFKKY